MYKEGLKIAGVLVLAAVVVPTCGYLTDQVNSRFQVDPDPIPTGSQTPTPRPREGVRAPVVIVTPTQARTIVPKPTATAESMTVTTILDLRKECRIAVKGNRDTVYTYTSGDEVWEGTHLTGVAEFGPYSVCVFPGFTLVNGPDGMTRLVLQPDQKNRDCAALADHTICTENTGMGMQVNWTRRGQIPQAGGILTPPPLAPKSRQTQAPVR